MVALRFPAAMGWGAAITIALFALLSSLVNVKFNADKPREAVRIDFTRLTRPPPVEPPLAGIGDRRGRTNARELR